MTANEFRNQTISNTRLAWLVYGHKVPVESLKDFTDKELRDIYFMEDENEKRLEIVVLLKQRGMNDEKVIKYLS